MALDVCAPRPSLLAALTCDSFILEGILTVVVALFAYFLVPNQPAEVNFLTPDEKQLLHRALHKSSTAAQMGQRSTDDHKFKWKHFMAAVTDWQVGALHPLCRLF
jgi:hypothetical protein